MSDITSQTLTSLVKNIKEKKLSSEEVTKAFVDRSEKSKELNAYITEDFSNAIDKAKKFDEKPNLDLKLPGIPMAVKDLFCTKDIRTTAGSKILENFVPTYESTVTENIWSEGGILLGKLNCDEFAMGSSNETSAYGNVINPYRNNNDTVTAVPPSFGIFKHGGVLRYINTYGNIRNGTAWQRCKDRWRGTWMALKSFNLFDGFADHSMGLYHEFLHNMDDNGDQLPK